MLTPCGPEQHNAVSLPMIQVACVGLIDTDNRILLAKRPKDKVMAGLWEFPGGKITAGETPEACLIRELKEELGITTFKTCLAPFTFASHAYEDFHLLLFLFLCRKWEGIPQGMEEQELTWVYVNALRSYALPPANSAFIPMLQDML